MKMLITSPVLAISTAYFYLVTVGIVLWNVGMYKDNNFFNWGPPIYLFNHKVDSNQYFYTIHLLIFIHQLINNWVNTVVYPWIINTIQDPKTKKILYSKGVSLLLINMFDLYSELDVMLILMGFTSQISFIVTVSIANVITSTIINKRYIEDKDEEYNLLNEMV